MKLIHKLVKHSIYYVSDNNIKYYINIPHVEFNNTNISLEFLENTSKYDPDKNDFEWVKNNIIDYYNQIDNDNITLVMPLLRDEEKNLLLTLNVNKLNYIEKIMALYINSSYLCLVKNNIDVNQKVFLIENNKFQNFIRYFKSQHNSRIIVKALMEVKFETLNELKNVGDVISQNANNKLNISVNTVNKKSDNEVIPPFSLNENALNEVIKSDIEKAQSSVIDNLNKSVDSTIVNNVPIMDKKDVVIPYNNSNNVNIEKQNSSSLRNNNIDIDEHQQNVNSNNDIIDSKDKNITLDNNNNKDNTIKSNVDNENIQKESTDSTTNTDIKEQKITNIINPNNSGVNSNNVNNVVPNNIIVPANGILDLNNLTGNGSIPSNVTINIEKLVTDDNHKKSKQNNDDDDDADEVGELDEDISDIEDDFDENEDFDIDAIDVSEAVLSNDDGNKNYRTISSGGVKFVVGRKDDKNLQPIEINKSNTSLDTNSLDINMPTNIVKGDDQINKNAGFASYFTLFFVAISAIFLIVYIIIK